MSVTKVIISVFKGFGRFPISRQSEQSVGLLRMTIYMLPKLKCRPGPNDDDDDDVDDNNDI